MGATGYSRWSIEQARAHLRVRRWARVQASGWCMAAFAAGFAVGVLSWVVGP